MIVFIGPKMDTQQVSIASKSCSVLLSSNSVVEHQRTARSTRCRNCFCLPWCLTNTMSHSTSWLNSVISLLLVILVVGFAHALHILHVSTTSGTISNTSAGAPAAFKSLVSVVVPQCHQRKCNLRTILFFCASVPVISSLSDDWRSNLVQSLITGVWVSPSTILGGLSTIRSSCLLAGTIASLGSSCLGLASDADPGSFGGSSSSNTSSCLMLAVGSSTAGTLALRGALFSRMLVFGTPVRSDVTACLQSGPKVCSGLDLGLSFLHAGHSKTIGSMLECLHSPTTLVCTGECLCRRHRHPLHFLHFG